MAWTAYILTQSLPYWPINPSIAPNAWFQFQLDLVRCLFAVLPGAILWGASFPLALASVASTRRAIRRRLVGGVYAANTLGAIVGSLAASLLLIVWLGTQHAQQVLIVVAALSGPACCWPRAKRRDVAVRRRRRRSPALLALSVHPVPGMFVAYGRYTATQLGQAEVIYVGEGWNASVAVSERSNGVRNYHNAGKVQASSEPQDMRLQRMLGHLTTLVPKQREDGRRHRLRRRRDGRRGVDRSGGRTRDDRRDRAARAARGLHLLRRAQLRRRAQPEGRRSTSTMPGIFCSRRSEKFDAITSDPLDPWVKGAAMLYTREFFELAKSAAESRRRRDAVRAAVREQHRGGEERDRDVLRGVPERDGLREHLQRRRATTSCCSGRSTARRSTSTRWRRGSSGRSTRRSRSRSPTSACTSAVDLFATYGGSADGPAGVAEGRADQPRPQPAAAVSGRPRAEPLSSRRRSTPRCCRSPRTRRACSPGRTRMMQDLMRKIRVAQGRE